jgi:dCTP deaminase
MGALAGWGTGEHLAQGERVSIRPDGWIRRMATQAGMIEPFVDGQVREGVVSYGLSSFGYDGRLAAEFRLPAMGSTAVLDPKTTAAAAFQEIRTEVLDLAPQSFCLGRTVEYFRIPPQVLAIAMGKSSYARCGVLVNVTPFEPGWEGHATLCIANLGSQPVRLHAGEGIVQVLFFESSDRPQVTYADRRGKYQAQRGVTTSRVD